MRDLIKQEQFEIEVLDQMKSGRFLDRLVFGGGTMLRLCFGLDRYSVDLDFWLLKTGAYQEWFSDLKSYLSRFYEIRDAADKFYTLIVELKSSDYPRSLKLEIHKDIQIVGTDRAIAYSRFSPLQVYVRIVSLKDMMISKIDAFLGRKEIRDAYDLEFLVKKGVKIAISQEKAARILMTIDGLSIQDYKVKLSSLLEADQREYYRQNNFRILKDYLSAS